MSQILLLLQLFRVHEHLVRPLLVRSLVESVHQEADALVEVRIIAESGIVGVDGLQRRRLQFLGECVLCNNCLFNTEPTA